MIYALTTLQSTILSIALVLIFAGAIFLLVKLSISNFKKSRKTKYMTLNQVIKPKMFTKFMNYQIEQKEEYVLFLININNLEEMQRQFSDSNITGFLKRAAKSMSIYLPYGGKLAQTKQRDLFSVYYPVANDDHLDFANAIKQAASELFVVNGNYMQRNINISYIVKPNGTYEEQMNQLFMGVVESKRKLGEIVEVTSSTNVSIGDYRETNRLYNDAVMDYTPLKVFKIDNTSNHESFYEMTLNGEKISTFLHKAFSQDIAWLNLSSIDSLLTAYRINEVKGSINAVIDTKTLENPEVINFLNNVLEFNQYLPEQTTLILNDGGNSDDTLVIKNIIELKNYHYKIAYELKEVSQKVYQIIQGYHIDRLIINEELYKNSNSDELHELLYFAKVNHLEVLYKNYQVEFNEFKDSNFSHFTKVNPDKVLVPRINERKRGKY